MAPRRLRRESQLAFEALTIEGGLLSPEWLAKVAQLEAPRQTAADYGIEKGLQIRDEIGRFWRMAEPKWRDFAAARASDGDHRAAAVTFVTELLSKVFGFDSLKNVHTITVGERAYPLEWTALDGKVPVVIAGPLPPEEKDSALDKPAPVFGDETRRRTAFGLCQEFLNASDGAMWGVVTDGLTLRLLRDNVSLTRPAWLEADLQAIFTGGRFSDFAALWLLLHQSRFGRAGLAPAECPLEQWRSLGREEGTRARDQLRDGVEAALRTLGQGFLAHRDNQVLRVALNKGTLIERDYFQQLLRLVYRIIFLLTVEERGLLHPEGTTDAAKQLYAGGYSLRGLRERALRRNTHDRNNDTWEAVKVVFRGLGLGQPALGLPALAGIFSPAQCPDLDIGRIENRFFLHALHRLSWLQAAGGLARVNWRDMGPEELGSVYESLLELTPRVEKEGREFTFAEPGENKEHARKTTGSYYTPDSLVQVLLDAALTPVIERAEAARPDAKAEALLELSVVDPACGSGHFLLAAARRIAARVAQHEAQGTASPREYRHALRRVVGRCIFGVDLNPLAVELCRVALWMEAVEPGLPLTFLDSHIRFGNALLGTTPGLMDDGIPNEAWDAFGKDDKKTASKLKERNQEGKTQASLPLISGRDEVKTLERAVTALDAALDADVASLAKKEAEWGALLQSKAFAHQRLVADTWCAAFVWPKPSTTSKLVLVAPTEDVWRQIRDEKVIPEPLLVETVGGLAAQYSFFHWELAFPQVFARGGFDVVLGNPPWIRQELLQSSKPALRSFRVFSGTADSSVYFLEIAVRVCRKNGRFALLTPNKWLKASYAEELRSYLRKRVQVELLIDFGHSHTLFPDADAFPAAIVARPVPTVVADGQRFRYLRAHDSDRREMSLPDLVLNRTVGVTHANLEPSIWRMESADSSSLLAKLQAAGRTLEEAANCKVLRGILTGFNEAFYVDGATYVAMTKNGAQSTELLHRFLRGKDLQRWRTDWAGQWHLVIPSSQNRLWPWSNAKTEADAESIFAEHHPGVHAHLKQFETQLRNRGDRGKFWWELRSCNYYELFERPKLVIQCIAYYAHAALDEEGYYVNNKILFVPTSDPTILATLNSRTAWWIMNKVFQPMKDGGLSVDVQFLRSFPIPRFAPRAAERVAHLLGQLRSASESAEAALVAEKELSSLVDEAFGLTSAEAQLIEASLPPRDPLITAAAAAQVLPRVKALPKPKGVRRQPK